MDLIKIGKFIQEQRRAKNLTQVQLAQKIGVSEKTISKWECGNGFPDTTLMLPLCKELNITSNELLSGKLLGGDKEYREQAEINLLNFKKVQEKNAKFLLTLEWIIGIYSVIILLASTTVVAYLTIPTIWRVIIVIMGLILAFIGFHYCLVIEKDAGFYECSNCHNKYVPTYKQVVLSRHIGRTRRMQCPMCHKKSWHKKTINKD